MSKSKKNAEIVKPVIEFNEDQKHVLATLFDGPADKVPEITSVGVWHVPGTNTYCSFVIKSKGREITSIEVGQPDLRQIAEDMAKVEFVNRFMQVEE